MRKKNLGDVTFCDKSLKDMRCNLRKEDVVGKNEINKDYWKIF